MPAVAQAPPASLAAGASEQGARWADLKPAHRLVLQPLERDWSTIDARSKAKWLELATRFPRLTPAQQARVQARMTDWTRMTPRERGEARLNFQEAKQLPAEARQARWQAYQALTPEQREQLAVRGAPAATAEAARRAASAPRGGTSPQAKNNIVPNPAWGAAPRPVAPTVVQASPGATTTLITRRPTPPGHQQPGLPKIAATPEFVNRSTLLPERGPQGAATRSTPPPQTHPSPP